MEFFITGTDTGCGKTLVTLTLMERLRQAGGRVTGMKPVAAGARVTADGLRNEDALAIQAHSDGKPPYPLVNPCCLERPVAPHLAAAVEGRSIDFGVIETAARQLRCQSDHLVVEGAGGWKVPLDDERDMADLCRLLELPVILVVGLKLGCINHALLTAEAILNSRVRLAGWVASSLEPEMPFEAGNLSTLEDRLPAPLLGHLPWRPGPNPLACAPRIQLPR